MTEFRANSMIYSFLLLCSTRTVISSLTFYPSLNHLVNSLFWNSSLPSCTPTSCEQTETQAEYPLQSMSDENLFKLANYDHLQRTTKASHGPYLISSTGIYRGKRLKYRRQYVDQFLGIYYAERPNSLEKPVKKHFQYSIQNASGFTPCCMQSLLMAENLSYGSFIMHQDFDEDCLSLNIYRADLRYGERRKAIMVFSHGGSNQLGGGSLFDGSILASEGDIIVITMNFRLNYHGFLSSGDDRMKGNYGLWDQLLAIEWIYENAPLFGGDPQRIVLAGHSAGAGNVMLIPASHHSRGMIRRVISQSGTGLAPWSINRQPLKLLERFLLDYNCQRTSEDEMIACVHDLLEKRQDDIYRLHLSLSIADDNPYPVIDHDFINDTLENIIQNDAYKNIDFLTGVTLNEGLYFAEYHIKHLYNILVNQTQTNPNSISKHQKRALIDPKAIKMDEPLTEQLDKLLQARNLTSLDQLINPDPKVLIEQFNSINYVERYIEANFNQSECIMDDVKKRYDLPKTGNITHRLQLYIDLVSDLMFNFHMVHCLNLRVKIAARKSSNYVYIYSHRPTYKVRSTLRDQLKMLPQAIGHFAELDYVFGVPLVGNSTRFHRNVNMSYYNYSTDEENFSRQIIRYWSNFIKTGNPNEDPLMNKSPLPVQWKPYTSKGHNYLFFQLNHIRNELNYFDSMYQFWSECFHIESSGECQHLSFDPHRSILKTILNIFICLFIIIVFLTILFLIWRNFHQKKQGQLLSPRSPGPLLTYPHRVSA